MSALGGIYVRSGPPVDMAFLHELSRALQPLGPDGEGFYSSATVGMVQRPFHVDTAPSRASAQPLVTAEGYVMAWDGRLDNGDEVEHQLQRRAAGEATEGDAALALAAYRAWGIEALGRLIGDFALALWDPGRQELVLACDSLGRRPLYYLQTPRQLIWSSRARAIIESLGASFDVEEEFVADFLTNWTPVRGPFRGVLPLPAGHALVAGPRNIALTRYWSFRDGEIDYRSDAAYEEQFLHLMRQAVKCRLRAAGPVFCELSGGLDSSSIACLAAELTAAESAPRLRTVSYVFDQARSSDERAYIRPVEQRLGRPGIHISEDEYPMITAVPPTLQPDLPANGLLFVARYDALARAMRAEGARVVLSGMGGDQMFWSEPPEGLPLADHLVRGRMMALLRCCHELSRAARRPFLGMLWAGACWPLLPRRWRALTQDQNPVGEWFNAGFVRRSGFKERVLGMEDDIGFRAPSRSRQYGLIRQTVRTYAVEPCASEGYRDVRYPYLDRRLVEFALGIPLEQKFRRGEDRSLVRRALRGVLPEEIRRRETKAGPVEAFHRALVRAWPWVSDLMRQPRVCAHGFADRPALVSALQRARHGVSNNAVQLMKTLALEIWLRSFEPLPAAEGFEAAHGIRRQLALTSRVAT